MSFRKTSRFRLYVILSILWIVILIGSNRTDDLFAVFIILGFPVWGFWSSVWIWPKKLEWVFGIGDRGEKKKELNKWVYLDVDTAKKSELYGVSGWAALLLVLILLPVAINIISFIGLVDSINALKEVTDDFYKDYPGYELLSLALNVQTWFFAVLSVSLIYLLATHKEAFQKFYIIAFIVSFIVDVILTIWMVNVLKLELDAVSVLQGLVTPIFGFVWIFYVIKSKRINLTTRKRMKQKYLDTYFPKDGNRVVE